MLVIRSHPKQSVSVFPHAIEGQNATPMQCSRFILLFIYVQVFNIGVCAVCLSAYTEPVRFDRV